MLKESLLSFLFIVTIFISSLSQHHANIWITGDDGLDNPNNTNLAGTTVFNFNFGPPRLTYRSDLHLDYYITNATICDSAGRMVLSTNGMMIRDFSNKVIADTIGRINEGVYWDLWRGSRSYPPGFPVPGGALFLPFPGSKNLYSLFYHYGKFNEELGTFSPTHILEARLYVNIDSNTSELVFKDSIIIHKEYLGYGKLAASRHANGRDWWIICPDYNSSKMFRVLYTNDGVSRIDTIEMGVTIKDGAGEAYFSSKGDTYIRLDAISALDGDYINIFSFDRCTGDFNHVVEVNEPGDLFLSGVSISPSGRYLYTSTTKDKMYQWDLLSDTLVNSRILIGEYDGFLDHYWDPFTYKTYFGFFIPGIDGRLYNFPPVAKTRFVHTIEFPDLPGEDCGFMQRKVLMPTFSTLSQPTFANYKLGPVDNSACDTLGLDNIPVAEFRYALADTIEFSEHLFIDLSYFRPESWLWNFDDGATSTEQHPLHTFASQGMYNVCLTVSNENGSDSTCKLINVITTSTVRSALYGELRVFPNPVSEHLELEMSSPGVYHVQMSSIEGSLVFSRKMKCPGSIT